MRWIFQLFGDTYIGDTSIEEKQEEVLTRLKEKLKQNPQKYPGRMRMCRTEFLRKLQRLANIFDTFLISDEVMTGFGITGDCFSCIKSQVTPDTVCLSKGITGGFSPLSVTICSDKIYDTFYSDDPIKTFI